MANKAFYVNETTGKKFEVIGRDKEAGTITLKGEYGEFTEQFDKEKFLAMGYTRVIEEVPDEEVE